MDSQYQNVPTDLGVLICLWLSTVEIICTRRACRALYRISMLPMSWHDCSVTMADVFPKLSNFNQSTSNLSTSPFLPTLSTSPFMPTLSTSPFMQSLRSIQSFYATTLDGSSECRFAQDTLVQALLSKLSNLRVLYLQTESIQNFLDPLASHYQKLERLSICVGTNEQLHQFLDPNNAIRSKPAKHATQSITHSVTLEIKQDDELKCDTLVKTAASQILVWQSLKYFTVYDQYPYNGRILSLDAQALQIIPAVMPCLTRFQLHKRSIDQYDIDIQAWIELFNSLPNLERLSLYGMSALFYARIIHSLSTSSLRYLQQLWVDCSEFSLEQFLCLPSFQSLTQLGLKFGASTSAKEPMQLKERMQFQFDTAMKCISQISTITYLNLCLRCRVVLIETACVHLSKLSELRELRLSHHTPTWQDEEQSQQLLLHPLKLLRQLTSLCVSIPRPGINGIVTVVIEVLQSLPLLRTFSYCNIDENISNIVPVGIQHILQAKRDKKLPSLRYMDVNLTHSWHL